MINLQCTGSHALDASLMVWMVSNKTSCMLFATEEMARKYVSGFAPSVGGGMHISSAPVFGLLAA